MKSTLRQAFEHEMTLARDMYEATNYSQSFAHLERAHILGQRHYITHVRNHYWMYKVALKTRDLREALGQIVRIIMSVGSLVGVVPLGNTGRARINPIKPMKIPSDLQVYFD
ncbi:hypothetical protein A9Q99_26060 [Gammaproteobacteria bacterium 45_16_T64]|nr:hypothetical protein A9Q99_26060 [Gammaproteobacteria bacterium 45_16_T64]